MKSFKDYLKEAEAEPQVIDGPNGVKTTINPDGTKTVSDSSGTKTYDANGQLVTTKTPNLAGLSKTTDVKSGDVTTDYSQGPLQVSQTVTPGGYTKEKNMNYDLGVAQLSQQEKGPDIASGQLAGTTTYNLKNLAGQQATRVQGVGFGGASGSRVGQNWVGADDAELEKVADLDKATAAAPAEDMHRLRKLSGITEKDIEEAPEPGATPPTAPPAAAPTGPAPKPANPPPMPPAGQDMDLTKVDNDTLFGKYQQLQSTINFMSTQQGDKQTASNIDPASQNMLKGMQDQLIQADKELKKRGYSDQQLKPAGTAPAKPLDQSDAAFKEELNAMLTIARLR